MILEGTILLGFKKGTQFRGKLMKYLSNECALLQNNEGEEYIVYNYFNPL